MDNLTQEKEWLLKEKYNGIESGDFLRDLRRLKNGEPLAYIIGHIPFLGTTMYLDSHPLIPRPETECWVEKIIDTMPKDKKLNILDLCAGSGCVGIAVLMHRENAHVDFVEIEINHHTTIRKNCDENDLQADRYSIVGGDLFQHVSKQYDYILANPPYIDPDAGTIAETVEANEPYTALFGGTDGMRYITRIIAEAPQFLKESGTLLIEHEPSQTKRIQGIAEKSFSCVTTHKDQFGVERYTIFTKN